MLKKNMFEDLKEDEIFVILCSSDNPFTFSLKSRSRRGQQGRV